MDIIARGNKVKLFNVAAVLLLLAGYSHQSSASVIVLDFENIEKHPGTNSTFIDDFYNGGTASNGNSGTNYGVSFSSNALNVCMNTLQVFCSNTSRGGQGNPNSQFAGLFFLSGDETYMNVAAGFATGFSFFYSAINQTGSVSVYDGLNGTGNLLATLALGLTDTDCPAGYGAGYCTYKAIGMTFSGIAKSVSFAGVADRIAFDDVTFGSATPDTPVDVPAPGMLALFGLGLFAVAGRRHEPQHGQKNTG